MSISQGILIQEMKARIEALEKALEQLQVTVSELPDKLKPKPGRPPNADRQPTS